MAPRALSRSGFSPAMNTRPDAPIIWMSTMVALGRAPAPLSLAATAAKRAGAIS